MSFPNGVQPQLPPWRNALRMGAAAALLLGPPLCSGSTPDLTLELAEQAALDAQPLLERQRAQIRAAEARAVSAAELPDPQLLVGFSELPANTADAFRFDRDGDTDLMVGVMQEFPRAEKRRLRGERERLAAAAGRADLAALEREIRRQTALAYIDTWLPERSAELVAEMIGVAEHERAAAEIALRAARLPQADVLAAEVELELLRDRARELGQQAAEAGEFLARWTGGDLASRATSPALPPLPAPRPLDEYLTIIDTHPALEVSRQQVAFARTEVALAEQAYRPDWRLDVRYGWRPGPGFSEMLTVMVGVDLPLFRRNRQDRDVAAARNELSGADADRLDLRRQLRAQVAAEHEAWAVAAQRLERYDEVIVPKARARTEAALAAYRTGSTELAAVLGARRAVLDIQLMRLVLQAEMLRRLAGLRYFDV